MTQERPLPCHPCPHRSVCCSWGADLSDAEALAIAFRHGGESVTGSPGSYRTRVAGGRCVFLRDNACAIHEAQEYPAVCRAYPWRDGVRGGPYVGHIDCPELAVA